MMSSTGPAATVDPLSMITMVSAKRTTSSIAWLTYTMGTPTSSRSRSINGRIWLFLALSREASGSSINRISGELSNARPMATRCRSPPERPAGRRSSRVPISKRSVTSSKSWYRVALLRNRCP